MDVHCECYFFVEDAIQGGEAEGVDGGGEDWFGGLGVCHGGIGSWGCRYGEFECIGGRPL